MHVLSINHNLVKWKLERLHTTQQLMGTQMWREGLHTKLHKPQGKLINQQVCGKLCLFNNASELQKQMKTVQMQCIQQDILISKQGTNSYLAGQ